MFGLGMQELLVILVIVLIIFGGKRLPEIGSAFGKSLREFKKATSKEKDEVSTWIDSRPEGDSSQPAAPDSEQESDVIKRQVNNIPGVKEAQEIKKTASKIKAASRMFLRK